MKKILSVIALSASVIGLSACKDPIEANKQVKEPIKLYSETDGENFYFNNDGTNDADFEECINNGLNQITEDGVYLLPKGFVGKVRTNSEDNCIADLKSKNSFDYNNNVVMMQNNDSLYLIYDLDDNDGFNPTNIYETFYFQDTNVGGFTPNVAEVSKFNKEHNAKDVTTEWGYETYIKFQENNELSPYLGSLSPYAGSQSNHTDEQGFKQYPIVPEGLFVITKVSDRMFKVTLNLPEEIESITAAQFHLINDSLDETIDNSYARLSIGDEKEWTHYSSKEYDVVGVKSLDKE